MLAAELLWWQNREYSGEKQWKHQIVVIPRPNYRIGMHQTNSIRDKDVLSSVIIITNSGFIIWIPSVLYNNVIWELANPVFYEPSLQLHLTISVYFFSHLGGKGGTCSPQISRLEKNSPQSVPPRFWALSRLEGKFPPFGGKFPPRFGDSEKNPPKVFPPSWELKKTLLTSTIQ